MQRAAFRTTRKALSAATSGKPKVTQTSFTKTMFTDTGNIPLVAANAAGCGLVIFFGGRKLLTHPDIAISEGQRLANEVQNEGPKRLEDADVWRRHHKFFSDMVGTLGRPLVEFGVGGQAPLSKWDLNFARSDPKELVPLERTDYFDDGFYTEQKPTHLSANEMNDMSKRRL